MWKCEFWKEKIFFVNRMYNPILGEIKENIVKSEVLL